MSESRSITETLKKLYPLPAGGLDTSGLREMLQRIEEADRYWKWFKALPWWRKALHRIARAPRRFRRWIRDLGRPSDE